MDVFDLQAMLSLNTDDYDSGLKNAKGSAESFGSAFGKVGSAVGTVAKATATAVGVVATGIGALTASAVKGYAQFEQLEGGVETLFGTGGQELQDYINSFDGTVEEAKASYESLMTAQNKVMENASNAYKTAGMSANEYMETVTSFSASLIQSLDGDTVKASEYADKAIVDMSDNANKMGTSIESIETAYQGFAKQNYTMLDNLKLGYGGTKSEMERLIEDADALSDTFTAQRDEAGNLTMSYADIVDAIHIVQDEMGITGTTMDEATTTIEGSLNMLKASWSNLVTGLADKNADLEELSNNVIESLVGITDEETGEKIQKGFIDNVIPVVEQALSSIGTLVEQIIPEALELIPTLISDFLPSMIDSASSLINGLVNAMESNIGEISSIAFDLVQTLVFTIANTLPSLIDMAGTIVNTIALGLQNNSAVLVGSAISIVKSLIDNISGSLPLLLDVGMQIIKQLGTGVANALPEIIETATTLVTNLIETFVSNLDGFVTVGLQIIDSLLTGLISAIPTIATQIISSIPDIIEAGLTLFLGLVDGLLEAIPQIIAMLPTLIDSTITALSESIPLIMEAGIQLFMALVEALPEIIDAVVNALPQIIDSIVRFLTGDGLPKILNGAIQMLMGIIQAIPTIVSSLASALPSIISTLVTFFINSVPQILSAGVQLLGGLLSAIPQIISKLASAVPSIVTSIASALRNGVSQIANVGRYLLEGLWSGISDKATWIYNQITSLGSGIINRVKSIFKVASPSKVFYEIGGYLGEGLGLGWQDSMEEVNKQIGKDLNYKGNIEVGTTVKDTTTAVAGKSLSDSDLDKLLSNLSINLYNTTEIDGQAIKKDSYKYTVTRMGDETRAVKVAMGGF
jgi:phage-related protein